MRDASPNALWRFGACLGRFPRVVGFKPEVFPSTVPKHRDAQGSFWPEAKGKILGLPELFSLLLDLKLW